jgi:hypothetical protein
MAREEEKKPVDIIEAMGELFGDPLGFVYFAFPWGEGPLKDEKGPDNWQIKILRAIGDGVLTASEAIQVAVSSGHGVGKSALVAWIILWFLSTRPQPQVVVTANTKTQLVTKTWRELSKWHKLAINKDWFEWTATKFFFKEHPETWFASAIPWSENRPEAFAGTHEKYVLMIFDEASAIPDIIWETAEGAMTTAGAIWLAFGNPTRNTGRFKECWNRFRHRWKQWKVDSRTAKKADKKKIETWIQDYGEDSDFVRIRVKGEFPRASSTQFIGEDLVDAARKREPIRAAFSHAPIVIGVDVARFGDDASVIGVRQGLMVHKIRRFRELSTMSLASYVVEEINSWQPAATFVDVVGIGAGVVDRLRQLAYQVIEVNGAERALKDKEYANLRAECWGRMREWLKYAYLPKDDGELATDLTAPEYGYDSKERLQIEKKEDMKERGLASPDSADMLAVTFAQPVSESSRGGQTKAETDFDVFAN